MADQSSRDSATRGLRTPEIEIFDVDAPQLPPVAAGTRKKVVGFSAGDELVDTQNRPRSTVDVSPNNGQQTDSSPPRIIVEAQERPTSSHSRRPSISTQDFADRSHLPQLSPEITNELRNALRSPQIKPRPVLRQNDSSTLHNESATLSPPTSATPQLLGALQAHERGKRLERKQALSRTSSPTRSRRGTDETAIEMQDVAKGSESSSEEDGLSMIKRRPTLHHNEAERIVKSVAAARPDPPFYHTPPHLQSGAITPIEELPAYEFEEDRPPPKVRGGILGMLLSLQNQEAHARKSPTHSRKSSGWLSANSTPGHSPTSSGASTPVHKSSRKHWYAMGDRNPSTTSLAKLVGTSAMAVSPGMTQVGQQVTQRIKEQKAEEEKRKRNSNAFPSLVRRKTDNEQYRITIHIAETIARQRYLERLCRALMEYGAPTHRLEEYMRMSARVLEIEAQFLYIPGSMIISFDDSQTHTASVRLVRAIQGLDLGKLRDVHQLYKEVVHDEINVEDATRRLNEIRTKPRKFNKWLCIFMYGLASAAVGPYAFEARLIDLPIAFFLGSLVGLLQLHFAPRSELYSNVFEISAAVLTSFLARAFGSIRGGDLFCFSALAQSSIALILPGYTVLCASLELQSRSIVAGSVRMVYAIIYSLFLGFGIMIGTAIYGRLDANATSATTCQNQIEAPYYFPSVPIFAVCLVIINQGKWSQMPTMVVIACCGYLTSHYASEKFSSETQISSTLGALVIGVMANTYSRVGAVFEHWLRRKLRMEEHPVNKESNAEQGIISKDEKRKSRDRSFGYIAAAAMLPAIFVQVPSGLAVSGSLLAGLEAADELNSDNSTTSTSTTSNVAFDVSYSVIEVAIGITVGLFLAAIVVYPTGKRRSGLFSF